MHTCLMLRTKDNRKLLTQENNLPLIKEYANTFKTEILLVRIPTEDEPKILELKKLAPAICNPDYKPKFKFEVVKKLLPLTKSRQLILKHASKIQTYIREKLLKQNPLSLKELKEKYADLKLTDACLCNHFTLVRRQLRAEGWSSKKTAAGTYVLEKSDEPNSHNATRNTNVGEERGSLQTTASPQTKRANSPSSN